MSNVSASAGLRALPAVATLVPERGPSGHSAAGGAAAWAAGPYFGDVQQLIASGCVPAAVLVSPADAHQAAAWLEALRRDPRLALAPVLLPRSFGEGVDALSDGVAVGGAGAGPAAPIAPPAAALGPRAPGRGDERRLALPPLRR